MDSNIFGKYKPLYELNTKLSRQQLSIIDYHAIKQQLLNLFGTDQSPAQMLITQYYLVEIHGKDKIYKHDKMEQAKYLIKNDNSILIYFKNPATIIRKMRNYLAHNMLMKMTDFNDCVMAILELGCVKDVVGKPIIELILDGLVSVCAYLDNPKDTCLTCPLCKNITTNPVVYPQLNERITFREEIFSVNEYSLKMVKETVLKERLKNRKIKIKSGKHYDKVVTLKSWSGSSVIVVLDKIRISIPIITMVRIPDELTYYLFNSLSSMEDLKK